MIIGPYKSGQCWLGQTFLEKALGVGVGILSGAERGG